MTGREPSEVGDVVTHDAGHLAIVSSKRNNHAFASFCWCLTLGVSFEYWNDRHTRHHVSPNHAEDDPDLQWAFGPALTPLMDIMAPLFSRILL